MIWVLAASVAAQCLAAGLAVRLIGVTGRRTAWALLATAMAFMAVRRGVPLVRLLGGDASYAPDPFAEILALSVSMLLAGGIAFVGPIFRERDRMELDLQRSNDLLRALLQSAPTPIFGLDLDGNVQHVWNPAAERLLGWSAAEVLGRPLPTVPPGGEAEFRSFRERIQAGDTIAGVEVRRVRRDGSPIDYSIHASPLRDAAGRITGNVAVLVDLTERRSGERERQARLRLAESMDRIHRAIQGTNDLERAMNEVLEATLSILDCDRAFLVYPCDPAAPCWRVPFERTRPAYPGAHAQGVEVPMQPEAARAFGETLASEAPVRFGAGSGHPLPEETARRFGFRAFLATAVRPRLGKPWQFGVHQCSRERNWTDEDCRLLQEIARRLEDAMTSLLAHRDLKENERQLRTLLESFPDLVARFDPQGRHLWVSPAMARVFGKPEDHFLGRTLLDLASPAEQETSRRQFEAVLQAATTGAPNQMEAEWDLPAGRRQFEVRHVPERDDAGRVPSVLGIARDVTERKQAERSLALMSFALDNVREATFLIDPGGRFLYVNEEACRALGYSRPELLQMRVPDVDPDYPGSRWADQWAEVRQQRSLVFEGRHRARDGRLLPVEINANHFEFAGQAYILALVRDIRERQAAQRLLQESEERLRLTLEATRIGTWDWDVEHDVWQASPVYYTALGYEAVAGPASRSEWMERVHPDDRARVQAKIADVLSRDFHGYEYEARLRHADGSYRWQQVVGFGIQRDPQGRVTRMLGIRMDIHERRQAEDVLARYAALVESSDDAILTKSLDGAVTSWNRGAERLFGYAASEMIGRPIALLIPEPLRDEERTILSRIVEGRSIRHYETQRLCKDGRQIDVSVTVSPLRGPDGAIVGASKIARDITERRQVEAELRQHREHLEELVAARTKALAAANRELESFSYSVSHDLRTPLRAIDGFSRMLATKYAGSLDDEARRLIGVVRDNAARMSRLIDDILAFSRSGRIGMRDAEVDMDRLVEEAWLDLAPSRAGREIQFDHRPLAPAHGDPALLRQVWLNLLSNALKFTRPVPLARIEVGSSAADAECAYHVSDNGVGFDPAYLHKLFGVFQRLHGVEEFEGTGIGLAIVQRVIARHGGRVTAEGRVGEGATFRFTLPRGGPR